MPDDKPDEPTNQPAQDPGPQPGTYVVPTVPQGDQKATNYEVESPETLDQDIAQGADRQSISPSDNPSLNDPIYTIKPLPEDHDTPFSEPDSPRTDPNQDIDREIASAQLGDTHQATDSKSDIDSTQFQDEGLSGAAEAQEPNAGSAVTGMKVSPSVRSEN